MRDNRTLAIGLMWVAIGLSSCGGNDTDSGPPPTVTTEILSDPAADGDVEQTSAGTYNVTQGMSPSVQTVLAGISPLTATEFRTFLDFPLSGPGGVPSDAIIESAYLDLHINNLQPITGSLPLRVELVAFQPPSILATDFDRTLQPALAFVQVAPPFAEVDVGTNASIDVTPLMIKAQELQLQDFQVRILEDLGPAILTLIEIDDSTGANRAAIAPLLTVTYF